MAVKDVFESAVVGVIEDVFEDAVEGVIDGPRLVPMMGPNGQNLI